MFKHPKCEGQHETVAQARECEARIANVHQTLGAMVRGETAPTGQRPVARGIVARNQALGNPARQAAFVNQPPPVLGVTKDGMYRDPNTGGIFKVQFPRSDSANVKRLYASLLVVDVEPVTGDAGEIVTRGERHWEYVGSAHRTVRPEWRLTVDEAKALGALYGTCVYGHALTKEESIRKGIGPICEEKYGMPA